MKQTMTEWLIQTLTEFKCQTGTIHTTDVAQTTLTLLCSVGLPDQIKQIVAEIPFGKGIAGAAAAQQEPIQLCNLQKDLGGVAKSNAQKTGVCGSLAIPIFSPNKKNIVAVIGVGMNEPHEFSNEEISLLTKKTTLIAKEFYSQS
jgi:L-methionine (R)-S-oxide reductase